MSTPTLPPVLDDIGVADWLGIPRHHVRRMIREKTIPHVMLPSGDVVFVASDLAKWIETQGAEKEAAHA